MWRVILWITHFGGPFCVLGWIALVVPQSCDFGVGESGLA